MSLEDIASAHCCPFTDAHMRYPTDDHPAVAQPVREDASLWLAAKSLRRIGSSLAADDHSWRPPHTTSTVTDSTSGRHNLIREPNTFRPTVQHLPDRCLLGF